MKAYVQNKDLDKAKALMNKMEESDD